MITDLLKTKTFYSGLGLVLYGLYQLYSGNQTEGIQNILTGLSVIFLRQGVLKNG